MYDFRAVGFMLIAVIVFFSRGLVPRVTRRSGNSTLPCIFVSVHCKYRLNWPLPPNLLCYRESAFRVWVPALDQQFRKKP